MRVLILELSHERQQFETDILFVLNACKTGDIQKRIDISRYCSDFSLAVKSEMA